MRISGTVEAPYIVLDDTDYRVLGPEDFGGPGLVAVESLGPYVEIKALGPLITIHDSTIEPRLGINHHPHRYNERIFYMEQGELDHSDSRNDITGHLDPGDTGLFTEGQHGMVHSEWNNGDVPSRIFILVYSTDPVPPDTKFTALADGDAPRYDEGDGVQTKEVVGSRSPLRVHGDVRFFADSRLEDGAAVDLRLGDGEGGLIAVREGSIALEDHRLEAGRNVFFPPQPGERTFTMRAAGPARLIRTVVGPGHGLVRE